MPIITQIETIARSQNDIVVQPRHAEAYERPAHIAHECQCLSDETKLPVVLLGKNGDRHTFLPIKRK